MKQHVAGICIIMSLNVFSQEIVQGKSHQLRVESMDAEALRLTADDKIYLNNINQRWSEHLNQSLLYNNYSTVGDVVIKTVDPTILKKRLAKLDEATPLELIYNPVVQEYVEKYLQMGHWMGKVMGLAEYYFPLFEEELAKYDIPLEIKYLAIVESVLNPRAGSHKGAVGLWQFTYSTGKMYELEINSYVDERMDPLKSTVAACQYMQKHYEIYGDWNLALAAYNSGAGNVNKAINRSAGHKNYWNIRRYLPKETQGYVPSFIAVNYLFAFAAQHNLHPNRLDVTLHDTDTVYIKQDQSLSFKQIAAYTKLPQEKIEFLNPQYKLNVIPRSSEGMYVLRLPQKNIADFVSQEKIIYQSTLEEKKKEVLPISAVAGANLPTVNTPPKQSYITKQGEKLSDIANRYQVTVSNMVEWNNLGTTTLSTGQQLVIYSNHKPKAMALTKKTVSSKKKITYQVKNGDGLGGIAERYGVSMSNLKKWNALTSSDIKIGQRLTIYPTRIPKEKSVYHTVKKGDTLTGLAQEYAVSIKEIMRLNNMKTETLPLGKRIIIKK